MIELSRHVTIRIVAGRERRIQACGVSEPNISDTIKQIVSSFSESGKQGTSNRNFT